MPVDFVIKPENPDLIFWKEKDLVIDQEYAKKVGDLMKHHSARENRGWSKDKTLKYEGSIPKEVYYEMIRKTKDKNYWRHNKGERLKKWLNANPYWRIGEKFVKG